MLIEELPQHWNEYSLSNPKLNLYIFILSIYTFIENGMSYAVLPYIYKNLEKQFELGNFYIFSIRLVKHVAVVVTVIPFVIFLKRKCFRRHVLMSLSVGFIGLSSLLYILPYFIFPYNPTNQKVNRLILINNT